jgi:hypothetical protein
MYEKYIKGKYNNLEMVSDSEDDSVFVQHVKSVSGGFKQFLKQKRAYEP